MTHPSILYIGNNIQDEYWFEILSSTLEIYSPLQRLDGIEALRLKAQAGQITEPALVIMDSGSESDLLGNIADVRTCLPAAKILVFSASPTWKDSRRAMYAGANDYSRKLLDRDEILERVELLIGPPPAG